MYTEHRYYYIGARCALYYYTQVGKWVRKSTQRYVKRMKGWARQCSFLLRLNRLKLTAYARSVFTFKREMVINE